MQILLESCENRSRATPAAVIDWQHRNKKPLDLKVRSPLSHLAHSILLIWFFFLMVPDPGEIVKDQAHYKW